MTSFKNIPLCPPDPIYGLMEAFKQDSRKSKVNLGIGVYKDAALTTPLMRAVHKAEQVLYEKSEGKTYLTIDGNREFLGLLGKLIFGEGFWENNKKRVSAIQTIGGTGALRLGADFLVEENFGPLLYSDPTWANHKNIFKAPELRAASYPYYNRAASSLDFQGMKKVIEQSPQKAVLLLHAACHNPSGADPTKEEWKEIRSICKRKGILPFFDFAYLGFGEGIDQDPWVVRYFAEQDVPYFLAFSCSKNFGLYGERVGAFFYVAQDEDEMTRVTSHLKRIVRARYSSPPLHGAAIVSEILANAALREEWEKELFQMHQRIQQMRQKFQKALKKRLPETDLGEFIDKRGMFSFLKLTEVQVETMLKEHAIYLTSNGRINLAGLTDENLSPVVEAIASVSGK
jgi:aspartate/tyrosine/aromatic aminotransferase